MISDTLYDYAHEILTRHTGAGTPLTIHKVCEYIRNQYSCQNRYYHNCWHIVDVLGKLDLYVSEHPDIKNVDEMRMALLLHDVIYDVPNMAGTTNEMKSAQIFNQIVKILPELKENLDCNLVHDLILSTQYGSEFEATEHDLLSYKLVHDIDFSSLGENFERFIRDGQNIRREYWLASDEEYKMGRIKFFQMMLSRDTIYLTDYYNNKHEASARQNMELCLLSNPPV